MSIKANAALFTGPNCVEIGEVELPQPEAGEVLLEIDYSCISPGTDLRTLAGKQWGAPAWPLVPGYSQVGKVMQRGEGVALEMGTRVFSSGTKKCSVNLTWGAHISHAIVPESSLFPIPEGVDSLEASLAKLAAISYHGSKRSRVKAGETVLVVGLGPIGILSAIFHQLAGAEVVAADLSEERVKFVSQELGIQAFVPKEGLARGVALHFPNGPDIIADSTGVEPVLRECLEAAKDLPWSDHEETGTRLLLQGSYAGDFTIDYKTAFMKEVEVIVTRDHQPHDIVEVLKFLSEKKLCIKKLITKLAHFMEAPDVYAALRESKGAMLTAALQWK